MSVRVFWRRVVTKSISVLIVVFIVLAAAARAQNEVQPRITVKTAHGTYEASAAPDFSQFALPIYPRAKLLKGNNQSSSLQVKLDIEERSNIHVVVARFRVPVELREVVDFYKKSLAEEVTDYLPAADDGSFIFLLKQKSRQRYVTLIPIDRRRGTEIDLVQVELRGDISK